MTKRTPAKTSAKAEESSVTEEIDSLMHNRGTALRVISRIKDTITVARMEQTELTLAQIKVYKSNAENAHSNFMKWHQEIITKLPSDKRQEQDQQHISFCDLYDEVAIHLQTCMENINAFTAPQLHNIQQPVVVQQPLPRVVPTFDGQFENWEKFKVMFKDIIDRSNELPRIKLYHLEKALIGDAAGLIDAKTISDGNYEYAWKILEERYADKRRLIDRHLEGILEVKRMVNENHIELQGIIEKFDSHIENLKHLGQELTGVSESLVVFLISRALDGNTRKLWESTMKKGELPTYHRTIIFLKEHASVLERCRKSTTHSEPQRATVKSSSLRANAATSTLPTNSCEFCSSKHYSFQCPEFNGLPVKQRHEKVKQQNVCFNCLRSGHRATNCPSKKTCSKCQRKHHTLLHQEGHITTFETPQDNTPVNASHSRVPVKPQLQTSQVLLLTALVDIIDRDEHPHQCRALIDSGSQVITKSMATDLNIQVEEVNIPISGIGSTRTTLKEKAIVQELISLILFSINLAQSTY
ncbi:uncharacterized protein LOC129780320 [Toxorhynchites rutilus septentrionalis]|uniref:uncharacterized protein LOC129780320 n=1 Tax=Toxorhynchites rutilus septentrionalis TaxID=329112 RepID=UPI00247A3ADE|nr:uncharacterized protein LOC129780320 [Toxorhynchites rutilus septentrionalis]